MCVCVCVYTEVYIYIYIYIYIRNCMFIQVIYFQDWCLFITTKNEAS